MHSLAVTEKRGVFKSWTVLLAIVTFALSLLGTFLVRSGVLTCTRSGRRWCMCAPVTAACPVKSSC